MNFNWLLDGSIVGLYLVATMAAGIMVRKYVGNVEQFLVAGREMNVFLGIASLAATEFGIVTCMYTAQGGYNSGFAGSTPGILQCLAMLIIGITGFCVKPLRDSGVMTIPELFEQRFGTFIRWLSGVVIVLGGLLNMGVFLRIGGEFLVLSTGMNEKYLVITMTVLLIMVAVYTILGGMLSVLVTDFLQFIVMSIGLLAVTYFFIGSFGWGKIVDTVEKTHGEGGFNPFVSLGWESVLASALVQTAATLTWQTTIARLMAAKDTWTGQKVYIGTSFFFVCRFLIPGIWGIVALMVIAPTTINSLPQPLRASVSISGIDKDTSVADSTKQALNLSQYTPEQLKSMTLDKLPEEVQKNVNVKDLSGSVKSAVSLNAMPVILGKLVPIGLIGILIAAMLAADMSTDSSYMITWAAVIYNDILGPFRKKKSSDSMGLLINRFIVMVIGLFLFFYGLFYKLEGSLWDYLQTTGTVYLSSMSVLLIACCYWKNANSWGATASIIIGAAFPIGYLYLEQVWGAAALKDLGFTQDRSKILAFALSAVAMVVFSLLKPNAAETATKPTAAA